MILNALSNAFIHAPGSCAGLISLMRLNRDQWGEFHHPSAERCMINSDTALVQNLLQISQGHRVSQVEIDCMKNGLLWKMAAFERDHTWHLLHKFARTSCRPGVLQAIKQKSLRQSRQPEQLPVCQPDVRLSSSNRCGLATNHGQGHCALIYLWPLGANQEKQVLARSDQN